MYILSPFEKVKVKKTASLVKSEKGKDMLVDDIFYWRCQVRECPARAQTQAISEGAEINILGHHGVHTHTSSKGEIDAL